MIIRKNGKYSSEMYKKRGLFLEKSKYNYFFDCGIYFKVEKKKLKKNNFFLLKNFF